MRLKTVWSILGACAALGAMGCSNGADPATNNDDTPIVLVEPEGCQSNADCAEDAAGPICDMVTNACRQGCVDDAGCMDVAGKPVCNTADFVCEAECTSDAECEGNDAGPVCDTDAGRCSVECAVNEDCAGNAKGPVCNIEAGVCAPGCITDADCADDAANPVCDTEINQCGPSPGGELFGGPGESAVFTKVHSPQTAAETPDLAFHERGELWVLRRPYEVEGECTAGTGRERCNSLPGYTTILFDPGTPDQEVRNLEDGNAWHFMRRPPAMAMGTSEYFATCGEAATGNFEDNDVMFIGPSLWSTDFDIYAQPSGGNGSHMDMLHATPFCMGIAHERDNVYWLFNGHVGSLDKYNFNEDHGPGAEDHSDGEIYRYAEGTVKRVPNVPSHMEYLEADKHLYVADTGNKRIIKLDTTSGERGGPFAPVYEELADSGYMDNATVAEVVIPGMLEQPSGLTIHDETLYITDHKTSKFHAFDLNGNHLRTLDTEFPEGTLAGLVVGPDNKIWFTDMKNGDLYRIDFE